VSWFTDFIGRFCRATKPRPQKSADFLVHLTSPLLLLFLLQNHYICNIWQVAFTVQYVCCSPCAVPLLCMCIQVVITRAMSINPTDCSICLWQEAILITMSALRPKISGSQIQSWQLMSSTALLCVCLLDIKSVAAYDKIMTDWRVMKTITANSRSPALPQIP